MTNNNYRIIVLFMKLIFISHFNLGLDGLPGERGPKGNQGMKG
jgi:hypothetical protein